MLQRLFTGDSLRRIKVQHLGEQIEGEWVRVWKQLRERHPWPDGQRTDVILCLECVQAAVSNTTKSFWEYNLPWVSRRGGGCPRKVSRDSAKSDSADPHNCVIGHC